MRRCCLLGPRTRAGPPLRHRNVSPSALAWHRFCPEGGWACCQPLGYGGESGRKAWRRGLVWKRGLQRGPSPINVLFLAEGFTWAFCCPCLRLSRVGRRCSSRRCQLRVAGWSWRPVACSRVSRRCRKLCTTERLVLFYRELSTLSVLSDGRKSRGFVPRSSLVACQPWPGRDQRLTLRWVRCAESLRGGSLALASKRTLCEWAPALLRGIKRLSEVA